MLFATLSASLVAASPVGFEGLKRISPFSLSGEDCGIGVAGGGGAFLGATSVRPFGLWGVMPGSGPGVETGDGDGCTRCIHAGFGYGAFGGADRGVGMGFSTGIALGTCSGAGVGFSIEMALRTSGCQKGCCWPKIMPADPRRQTPILTRITRACLWQTPHSRYLRPGKYPARQRRSGSSHSRPRARRPADRDTTLRFE
jgi:hypothetical protein